MAVKSSSIPAPPAPIDASYKPKASVTTLPATAPIAEILSVLERDGGVILKDLVSSQQLQSIDSELQPWKQLKRKDPGSGRDAFVTIPQSTVLIPGLVGKSATVASICENDTLEQLRQTILKDEFVNKRENFDEQNTINPLLSLSIAMNIGYGSPRQLLHRDDGIHAVRHVKGEFRLDRASQFGCLIAGCEVTREKGATMFVPGSHKWGDDHCAATADDVCFAGMSVRCTAILITLIRG
jgi:ectoine hydroxylase-related dioxygenase (phytanoyl-CoA dioxygenase family)